MSDESGQREHEQAQEQPPKWGDPISPERQAELQGYLDRWQAKTDHRGQKGPFDNGPGIVSGVPLTGADVCWLAEQSESDLPGSVPNLHCEGATLDSAHLETLYCQPLA